MCLSKKETSGAHLSTWPLFPPPHIASDGRRAESLPSDTKEQSGVIRAHQGGLSDWLRSPSLLLTQGEESLRTAPSLQHLTPRGAVRGRWGSGKDPVTQDSGGPPGLCVGISNHWRLHLWAWCLPGRVLKPSLAFSVIQLPSRWSPNYRLPQFTACKALCVLTSAGLSSLVSSTSAGSLFLPHGVNCFPPHSHLLSFLLFRTHTKAGRVLSWHL